MIPIEQILESDAAKILTYYIRDPLHHLLFKLFTKPAFIGKYGNYHWKLWKNDSFIGNCMALILYQNMEWMIIRQE